MRKKENNKKITKMKIIKKLKKLKNTIILKTEKIFFFP